VIIRDIGFSSPGLSCGLCTQAVKYCGTVRTNKTRISMSLREKTKLKYGGIKTRIRGNLTASVERQTKCKHIAEYAPPITTSQLL